MYVSTSAGLRWNISRNQKSNMYLKGMKQIGQWGYKHCFTKWKRFKQLPGSIVIINSLGCVAIHRLAHLLKAQHSSLAVWNLYFILHCSFIPDFCMFFLFYLPAGGRMCIYFMSRSYSLFCFLFSKILLPTSQSLRQIQKFTLYYVPILCLLRQRVMPRAFYFPGWRFLIWSE